MSSMLLGIIQLSNENNYWVYWNSTEFIQPLFNCFKIITIYVQNTGILVIPYSL